MSLYSTERFDPAIRKHLIYYTIHIVEGADAKCVCTLQVLGLDKAEAIGRTRVWFGDRIAKGDWRMIVE